MYLVEKTNVNSLPKDLNIITFSEWNNKVPIALFTRSASEKLNFKEEPLPVLPYKEIKRQIVRKKRQLEEVDNYLIDQAENISLKAQLGNLSEEEKDVQKQLSASAAEISRLSNGLTTVRAQVLASKARLLEATAELKAVEEKKG